MKKIKKIFFYLLWLNLIKIYVSLVPIWNLSSSSIDIYKQYSSHSDYYEFTIVEKELHDNLVFKLSKKLTKNINKITIANKFELKYENEQMTFENVPWEDIESAYTDKNDKYYICPKGKFHLFFYDKINNIKKEIIPTGFIDNGKGWELKCYYQIDLRYIFIGYLNYNSSFYQLNIDSGEIIYNQKIEEGIFDYKWTTYSPYEMVAILSKDNNLTIKDLKFSINGAFSITEGNEKNITKLKSNYKAFFNYNPDDYNFYWINYYNNSDYNFNFTSGYYNNGKIDNNNIENININYNNESPLEFLDKVVIKQMNFIPYTKYIYYEIYNDDKKETYHGIIDIELNKVIFNTNEEISKFIPFSDNSMLAITNISAYKICTVFNNDCIDKCDMGKLILDTQKPNECDIDNKCQNYILMPNEVCVESCDENIFTTIDNNKCGLCRDINKDNPYKLLNSSKCFKNPPEGTQIINDYFKFLNCSKGYILENDECILNKCHDNCKTCSNFSENDNDQKCNSCKNENNVLYKGNCISECPIGFYQNSQNINNECEECDKSCEKCELYYDKCISCSKGKYLNDFNYSCENCNQHCETCEKGEYNNNENCKSCYKNSEFRYLVKAEGFDSNCVKDCPENTILSNYECIINKNNNENKKENKILFIYILIIGFLLLIFTIYFYIIYCCKEKKDDEALINKINRELTQLK